MIKIIKPGNKNRKIRYIYNYECEKCGCIFEFEYEDIEKSGIFKDMSIKCPCCNIHYGIILKDLNYKIVEITEEVKEHD